MRQSIGGGLTWLKYIQLPGVAGGRCIGIYWIYIGYYLALGLSCHFIAYGSCQVLRNISVSRISAHLRQLARHLVVSARSQAVLVTVAAFPRLLSAYATLRLLSVCPACGLFWFFIWEELIRHTVYSAQPGGLIFLGNSQDSS